MNNIYVDELPKKGACFNGCPYAVTDTWVYYCPFQQEENGDHLIVEEDCIKACPLKLLKDSLAEERKKVVQEIREMALKREVFYTGDKSKSECKNEYCIFDFELDEIEKGVNDAKNTKV